MNLTRYHPAVFDDFDQRRIETAGASINLRIAGEGPPLLLLHGYPQTHAMWHAVAPALAQHFTVVCPDLRGYGDSSAPPSDPEHLTYSKRAMAQDMVEVMEKLGFQRFFLAGHDRGGRVAYRLAFDHPDRVARLATLDIVPTHATFAAMDWQRALGAYHWLFLAQPTPHPETMIGANPGWWLEWTLRSWAAPGFEFDPEALAEYRRCWDADTIRATCEDYRAGATIDFELDAADLAAGRKITCPLLVLWGESRTGRPRIPLTDAWHDWATDVRGHAIPSGHFLAEEAPQETARALEDFFLG